MGSPNCHCDQIKRSDTVGVQTMKKDEVDRYVVSIYFKIKSDDTVIIRRGRL